MTGRVLLYTFVALLFSRLTGNFSIGTALAGLAILLLLEVLWRPATRPLLSPRRLLGLARFLGQFIVDLAKSNLILAWDVLTPHDYHKVTMVEVPVDDLSAGEIALLAHRITLTPGTLSCGHSPQRKVLIVHAMYSGKGPEAAAELRHPIDLLRGGTKR